MGGIELPKRVTLDRSALNGDFFQALREPVLRAIDTGIVVCVPTMTFMMETIELVTNHSSLFDEQRSFMLKICEGNCFRPLHMVRADELRGELGSPFLSDEQRGDLRDTLQESSANLARWLAAEETDLRHRRDRKKNLEQTLKDMRRHVRALANEDGVDWDRVLRNKDQPMMAWAANELVPFGRDLLHDNLIADWPDRGSVVERWARDPNSYQYTTMFITGFVYAMHAAMIESRKSIDRNAQDDIELLCFCQDVDIVVSNESRFMKQCFDVLVGSSKTEYLTTMQFLERLETGNTS